ncbi:MAG: hypothetical protein K8M05_23020 [Deltaproteobacteria bacterium]|nr:hypothetical protein [Kofleriaceae bacterium]
MPGDEAAFFSMMARQLVVRGYRAEMALLGLSSLLAWRSFNGLPYAHGVGGIPTSMIIDASGIRWMPDSSIYLLETRPTSTGGSLALHPDVHRITIAGREDFVAVSSTITGETRILDNSAIRARTAAWIQEHGDSVLDVVRSNRVALVSFVALITRRTALVELPLAQGRYVEIGDRGLTIGKELQDFFLAPPPTTSRGQFFAIPLGDPPALAIADRGGPQDEYELQLGVDYVLTACAVDGKFAEAERVWRELLKKAPTDARVLVVGAAGFDQEPGGPRLPLVAAAWEDALAFEPALAAEARGVAGQLSAFPEIAARLLRAANVPLPQASVVRPRRDGGD